MREVEQILGAKYLKDIGGGKDHRLWKLSRECVSEDGALKYSYVLTSAAYVRYSGPETYLFPSDKDGNILEWSELPGSFKGDLDHNRAIAGFCLRDGSWDGSTTER